MRPGPRHRRPSRSAQRCSRGLLARQEHPTPGERGYDSAKKINGIKRHILIDTAGQLLAVHATAASVQDKVASGPLPGKNPCRTISHIWADKGYTGQAPAQAAADPGIDLEIASGPKPATGFVVQPRRWVVARTNGWINRDRRLVGQYEATLTAHEAFVTLSQIRLLVRRLGRPELFDTL